MIIEIPTPTKTINSRLFFEETGFRLYLENDRYWLEGETDEKTLLTAYSNHNPENLAEIKAAEKVALLAKLGITEDEAKLLLS